MSTKVFKILASVTIAITLVVSFMAFLPMQSAYAAASPKTANRQGGNGNGNDNGNGQGINSNQAGTGTYLNPLSDVEVEALNRAILEEYGAYNLYQSVVTQLGNVYPFVNIIKSEQQHINALTRQAVKYGVSVPVNPGLASTPTFSTLREACAAGVNAELTDIALYDELSQVVSHTDILRVFNNLQSASLNNHLLVFQSCQ